MTIQLTPRPTRSTLQIPVADLQKWANENPVGAKELLEQANLRGPGPEIAWSDGTCVPKPSERDVHPTGYANSDAGKVSAEDMRNRIVCHTIDEDGQAAGSEHRDLSQWVEQNGHLMSAEAKEVWGVYDKTAKAAQKKGQTGIRKRDYKAMVDEMDSVVRHGDASAGAAVDGLQRKLDCNPNKKISGAEMEAAIKDGTKDLDRQAANDEYAAFARFANANWDRLSPDARAKMRAYEDLAMKAQSKGETGLHGPTLYAAIGRAGYPDAATGRNVERHLEAHGERGVRDAKLESYDVWSLCDPSTAGKAKAERFLRGNNEARGEFEHKVGGRVVDWGRSDGKILVQRDRAQVGGFDHMRATPTADCQAIFRHMDNSVLGHMNTQGIWAGEGGCVQSTKLTPSSTNPLWSLLTCGVGAAAQMFLGGGLPGLGQGAFGFGGLVSPFGGAGFGSWNPLAMPGRMQNTNPMYERFHQMQVSSVLNDPSLTVEDKVTLMLMLIMKKMDKDVERQAQYINSIQQQQSNRSQGGGFMSMVGTVAGGMFGGAAGSMVGGQVGNMVGGGGNNSPSIDVETMKLKRMIDKRGQMFDMLRQIIDKYNETAKGIIQSIGR